MMDKDNNISNFGDELKKNPFSVPDEYFEQLPSRIQERCKQPKPKKSWVRVLIPQLGFVAGFLVLLFFAKGLFDARDQNANQQSDQAMVAQLTDTSKLSKEDEGETFAYEDMAIDDAIITYLVDNNISDLDIIQ